MERILLLGGTGSVGSSVLDVLRAYPERFRLTGVTGFSNLEKLSSIIKEFSPTHVGLGKANPDFESAHPGVYFYNDREGLEEMTSLPDIDTVIIAISGIAGLRPTLSAIEAGKKILTANKESIVSAGEIVNKRLDSHNNWLISLDSEHNAIFNQMIRMKREDVRDITLTASGGPFRDKPINDSVGLQDVLAHPTWDMGQYITVNSATMMNKGFEVIEAHYLFGLPYEKIQVLIHPQSLVHGIVTSNDGSHYLAASPSDMRFPVSLALFYPQVPPEKFPQLELAGQSFEFYEPDIDKFPLLALAYACGQAGGIMPAVLNAANEIVVEKFLKGLVYFSRIPEYIATVIERFENKKNPSLEEIMIADKQARIYALELVTGALET